MYIIIIIIIIICVPGSEVRDKKYLAEHVHTIQVLENCQPFLVASEHFQHIYEQKRQRHYRKSGTFFTFQIFSFYFSHS